MDRKICIIETDDGLRGLLKTTLQDEGYDVEDFSNAYPLFEVSRDWPDLFLIEIELESINGLEICRWIKTHQETQHIPVVLICGSPELEVLANDAKADGFISKPIVLPELLKILSTTQHVTVL